MTDEILDRANDLKYIMKHLFEMSDVLDAPDLVISITGKVDGINRTHECQGDGIIGKDLKEGLKRIISEKISQYIKEYNAL